MCVREKERVRGIERVNVGVCVRKTERERVCVRWDKRESVYVCVSVCACALACTCYARSVAATPLGDAVSQTHS